MAINKIFVFSKRILSFSKISIIQAAISSGASSLCHALLVSINNTVRLGIASQIHRFGYALEGVQYDRLPSQG